MPVRLPVFINLMLLGYCLPPGLSERKLPEKISCGVQTVAPSLFSLLKKRKFSNTCILKLNIKALVRVWGERGQNYRVSRKGEIKCVYSQSIDTPGSNDLGLCLGATLRKAVPGSGTDR